MLENSRKELPNVGFCLRTVGENFWGLVFAEIYWNRNFRNWPFEAREFIIALPESFPNLYEPDKLLQLFTDRFKKKYGVGCVPALHHNKRKTNYHIHLIFPEQELLSEPIKKTATRNIFYDGQGKHVRTKKEILDENGNVRKGCKSQHKNRIYSPKRRQQSRDREAR